MLWDFINCCYHQIFAGHVVNAVAPEDSFSLILRNLGQGLEKTGWHEIFFHSFWNYRWTAHQIFILRYLWYMSSHWVNLLEGENWKGINILGILPLSIACKLWSFGPTAVPKIAILAVINSNNNYYKNYYYCKTLSIWKREQIKWIKI